MRYWIVLFILFCQLVNDCMADPQVNQENYSLINKESAGQNIIEHSIPVLFDLIVDEKITQYDPRLKSIAYTALSGPQKVVIINYVNVNALPLANKIAGILNNLGVVVLKPVILVEIPGHSEQFKYVTVYIEYSNNRKDNDVKKVIKEN